MFPDFRDPIFRGCTRPAMFAGVPMLPFLAVTGTTLLIVVWTFYLLSGYVALFLVITYIPLLVAMREVTKKDDQRLRQLVLRFRMRHRQQLCRRVYGAVSFSALRFKHRKSRHAH